MVAEAVKVGENRYRESYGRYFEDFRVGDVYEHRPGRTISEADNTWFTLLTMNQHPLHFDREYVRAQRRRRLHPVGHGDRLGRGDRRGAARHQLPRVDIGAELLDMWR